MNSQEERSFFAAQEEAAFERKSKAVYRELLDSALRGLGREAIPEGPEAMLRRIAQLEMHLADARAQLRILCADFGDNEWDDDDYLPDVIEKHLRKHLICGNLDGPQIVNKVCAECGEPAFSEHLLSCSIGLREAKDIPE